MKILITILLLVSTLFALSITQEEKIQVSYNIGKNIKAKDGMTFENTLPSIMGQESSWGIYVLGDKWDKNGKLKSVYESSLGNFQIKLSTAKLTIKKYPELYRKYGHLVYDGKSVYLKYEKYKTLFEEQKVLVGKGYDNYVDNLALGIKRTEDYKKILYYSSIIKNPKWIKRYNEKTKQGLSTMKWAKKELAYHTILHNRLLKKFEKNTPKKYNEAVKTYKEYEKILKSLEAKASKDTRLINRLLTDFAFSSEIAGHYLLSMYEESSRKFGKSEAYWRAIGRYNGGWSNKTYYSKVIKRMKTVKKVMKYKNLSIL